MKKKTLVLGLLILFVLASVGTVFAQTVCNYYESDTPQIEARISTSGRTATIDVKSYVSRERIEIYQVVINGETFTAWDITGAKEIGPHGSTTITVTKSGANFPQRSFFKVYLKTCE